MNDLPRGWTRAALAGLIGGDGVFTDGDWVETKDQDPAGDVRLTQLADVGEGEFRNRSNRFLRTDQAEALGCTYLRPGDLLIARMPDPLGRACLVPDLGQPAVTAVDVCIVRPGSGGVDRRWLMWAINAPQFRRAVAERQTGTTRKRISRTNLASIPLPVPPLAEQRRIVVAIEEQFSRLDAADDTLQKAVVRMEGFRRSALHAPLSEASETRALGKLASTQLGKMLSSKARAGANSRPYLRNKNVRWYGFELDDLLEMDFNEEERAKFALHPGDVVVCEGGEVGRSAVWQGEIDDCYFQKAVHRVRTTEDLEPEFLVHVLRWFADTNAFERYITGSTINHLPQEDLRMLPIPAPPIEQQRRIVAEIDRQVSLIQSLRAAVESARKRSAGLRRAILERAFRGELVPQDPDEEPASALLERVCSERAAGMNAPGRRGRIA